MKVPRYNSVKIKLAVILMGVLIPLVSYLLFYNFFMIRAVNEKITESNSRTLQLYCMNIDDELAVIENILLDFITNNADFAMLRMKRSNHLDVYLHTYEIIRSYSSWLNAHASIGALYIVNRENNVSRGVFGQGDYTYQTKVQMDEYVQAIVDTTGYRPGWFAASFGNRHFLCRLVQIGGVYTFCMIDLDKLNLPQHTPNLSGGGQILFQSGGKAITGSDFIKENEIVYREHAESMYYIAGRQNKYIIIDWPIQKSNLTASLLIPYNGSRSSLGATQINLFILSLATVLLIPLAYYLLYRTFTQPMTQLLGTIQEIRRGNMEAKLASNYSNYEFNQVTEAFNTMMDQIMSWKNSYFEKELAERQAHLQYLQMQIRPHFYLNCLKNLYGMAQEKQYDDIQQTILHLSKYLRYMMQDKSSLIPLGEELEHVRSLLAIHQISAAFPLIYQEDVGPGHLRYMVPPISALTFVENAIKHGVSLSHTLQITIRSKLLANQEGDILNITITDNGSGFPAEVRQGINSYTDYSPAEGRIGIYNVIQRLQHLYGNKAGLVVSVSGGSAVDLFLPAYFGDDIAVKESVSHDVDDLG